MGSIVKRVNYQTGKTQVPKDIRRKALPPGVRKSAKGKLYEENRRNRSDRNPKRRL